MKRRWFAVIGALMVVGETVVFVAFSLPSFDTETALSLVVPAVCGALFVLGGFGVGGGYVGWNQFIGVGDVLLGIWLGVSFWRSVTSDPTLDGEATAFFTVISVVGGLSMVLIGSFWFRGGDGFGIEKYEPGPLF